ncbi:S8 family serine peptidase [Dyella humicola]|uniref:S8 family serine peptidase n=1 Tax=Dyella humicola TaxID=2992126 RepID=UPI00225BDDC0|nr:S8 family serine peptidase [Dyella humicola]
MNRSILFRLTALAAAIGFSSAHAASPVVSPDALTKINPSALTANQTFDGFIVVYRNGSTENANGSAVTQNVNAAVSRAKLDASAFKATPSQAVSVAWKRKLSIGADLVRTNRKLSQNEAASLMQQIAADPAVVHVEPDVRMQIVKDITATAPAKPLAVGTSTPNDPSFQQYQWHMRPGTGESELIGADTVPWANLGGSNASAAWPNYDGTGVTVAEIDTGVTQHPDLNLALAASGYDFITDAATSGRATDGRVAGGWDTGDWTTVAMCGVNENSSWHGTHVFGNIGEITNNGVGMTGVAPGSQVVPIRVLGHCGGSTSDIVDAITWASGGQVAGVPTNPHPAQIISMSLGGQATCSASDVTAQAIAGAISRGTTVVVAAGNNGADTSGFTPSSCPGVIAVSSVGITGRRAFYSNFGNDVTIAAPGGGIYANDAGGGQQIDAGFIWSTLNDGATTPGNPIYGKMAGTSQATPHVTGVVALMIGAVQAAGLPALTPVQIQNALIVSARKFPITEDHPIGAGIVDAAAAVQAALNANTVAPAITLTSGVPATAAGNASDAITYSIYVPPGSTNFTLRTIGGTGDVSLYAKLGIPVAPNGANADFSSVKPNTNNETIVQTSPAPGIWYVSVVGVKAFANVQVIASYVAH